MVFTAAETMKQLLLMIKDPFLTHLLIQADYIDSQVLPERQQAAQIIFEQECARWRSEWDAEHGIAKEGRLKWL